MKEIKPENVFTPQKKMLGPMSTQAAQTKKVVSWNQFYHTLQTTEKLSFFPKPRFYKCGSYSLFTLSSNLTRQLSKIPVLIFSNLLKSSYIYIYAFSNVVHFYVCSSFAWWNKFQTYLFHKWDCWKKKKTKGLKFQFKIDV